MIKNLNLAFLLLLAQFVFASIKVAKLSDINQSTSTDASSDGSFFSHLQRRLAMQSKNDPTSLINLGMDPINQSELTFQQSINGLKTDLDNYRKNAIVNITSDMKNKAINMYIANAEFTLKKNIDLNASKVERKMQQLSEEGDVTEVGTRLTDVVGSKPERMLKQVRKIVGTIDNKDDLKKMDNKSILFDFDENDMYNVTQDDLNTFISGTKMNGN